MYVWGRPKKEMPACKYPQRRNTKTGRCKKPCKKSQRVNPRTGRCVSKSHRPSRGRDRYIVPTYRFDDYSMGDAYFDTEAEFLSGAEKDILLGTSQVEFESGVPKEEVLSDEDVFVNTGNGADVEEGSESVTVDDKNPEPVNVNANEEPPSAPTGMFDQDESPTEQPDETMHTRREFAFESEQTDDGSVGGHENAEQGSEDEPGDVPSISKDVMDILRAVYEASGDIGMEGLIHEKADYTGCNRNFDTIDPNALSECGITDLRVRAVSTPENIEGVNPELLKKSQQEGAMVWVKAPQTDIPYLIPYVMYNSSTHGGDVVILMDEVYWRITVHESEGIENVIHGLESALKAILLSDRSARDKSILFADLVDKDLAKWVELDWTLYSYYDTGPTHTEIPSVPMGMGEVFMAIHKASQGKSLEGIFQMGSITKNCTEGLVEYSTHGLESGIESSTPQCGIKEIQMKRGDVINSAILEGVRKVEKGIMWMTGSEGVSPTIVSEILKASTTQPVDVAVLVDGFYWRISTLEAYDREHADDIIESLVSRVKDTEESGNTREKKNKLIEDYFTNILDKWAVFQWSDYQSGMPSVTTPPSRGRNWGLLAKAVVAGPAAGLAGEYYDARRDSTPGENPWDPSVGRRQTVNENDWRRANTSGFVAGQAAPGMTRAPAGYYPANQAGIGVGANGLLPGGSYVRREV